MSKTTSDNDAIEIRKDVTYATHDGVQLSGDLYLPRGAGPFPAPLVDGQPAASRTSASSALASDWFSALAYSLAGPELSPSTTTTS